MLEKKQQESSINEVRILASVQHPNVISYKEAFWDDNTNSLNIVMEYADDGDLYTKIKKMKEQKMRISSNDNITINNVKKNKNNKTINNMNYNIIMLQQSRNFYNNKSFKTNNIFISKNLKMNKSMTNLGTPENIKINSIFNNNFNQILYSNDKKICIRLHVLKCKNIFIFNTKNYKKCLKIQKVIIKKII